VQPRYTLKQKAMLETVADFSGGMAAALRGKITEQKPKDYTDVV
jgi:hypothetical protein